MSGEAAVCCCGSVSIDKLDCISLNFMQLLLSDCERCTLNAPVYDLIDTEHLQGANALREVASNDFCVRHHIAHDDA